MPDLRCPDCRSRLTVVSAHGRRLYLRVEHDPTCPALRVAGGPHMVVVHLPKEKKA